MTVFREGTGSAMWRPRISITVALIALSLGGCASFSLDALVTINGERMAAGIRGPNPAEHGKAFLKSGQLGLAESTLRSAIDRGDRSVATLNALAITYDLMGRFDLSHRYYEEALVLDPKSVQTLNNIGFSMLLRKQTGVAETFLSLAGQLDAGNETVATNLALVEAQRDRLAYRASNQAAGSKHLATGRSTGGTKVPAPAPDLWIERTGQGVQTIVFRPDSSALNVAGVSTDAARLASVNGRYATGAANADGRWNGTSPGLSHPMPARADFIAAQIEVINGTGRRHMAARLRAYLHSKGIPVPRLSDEAGFGRRSTLIRYRSGYRDVALALASVLAVPVDIELVAGGRSPVRILLGNDLIDFDDALILVFENDGKKRPIAS